GPVFLPEADSTVQTLFLLGTFAATFLARPLGGIVFGWLGDRIGRQKTLAMTLILMVASTLTVGVLPGYTAIGIWAAVLLVLTKLVQGFSTGGEYAGAATFVSEHAPDKRRGFFTSLLDMGSYLGFAIGAAVVSLLQLGLGQAAMEEWGWRIPFLIAGPLGIIAIYFRLKVVESPTFQATLDARSRTASRSLQPAAEMTNTEPIAIVKAHWRPIVLAMILVAAANIAGYAFTSYMPTHLIQALGYDDLSGTLVTIPILVAMSLSIPLAGRLSDRIGRRPVLWIGAGSTVVLAIPAFLLIAAGDVWLTLLGLVLIALPVTFYWGNIASALPALFPTTSRYGAMGISYNFSVALFGGTTPFVIAALVAGTGIALMPAYYLIASSAVAGVAIFFMKETAGWPLKGSMPSVSTAAEAHELVAHQDENPLLDAEDWPLR
ncbi:MAG TPA: MFS transporter, partial [Glaciibacter sp.]|nr:MFS transporter [Glaciibacter sp.]